MKSSEIKFCFVGDDARQPSPPKGENGINLWAEIFNGDYLYYGRITLGNLEPYNVVMFNLNLSMIGWPAYAKAAYPEKLMIGLLDGSIDEHNVWPPDKHAVWVRALRTVDVVGVLDDRFVPYIQALTPKKVAFLGVPFISPEKPEVEKKYDLLAHSCLYMQRNGLSDLVVIEKSGLKGIAFAKNQEDFEATKCVGFSNIEVVPRVPYFKFLNYLAQSRICLSLDTRYTWGRLALDCAAFGIPCIGTDRQYAQRVLFPELTTPDPFNSTDWALKMIGRLGDKDFHDAIISQAKGRLPDFGIEARKKRFLAAIGSLE